MNDINERKITLNTESNENITVTDEQLVETKNRFLQDFVTKNKNNFVPLNICKRGLVIILYDNKTIGETVPTFVFVTDEKIDKECTGSLPVCYNMIGEKLSLADLGVELAQSTIKAIPVDIATLIGYNTINNNIFNYRPNVFSHSYPRQKPTEEGSDLNE